MSFFVDKDKCTGCGVCVEECSVVAINIGNEGIAMIDQDECMMCGCLSGESNTVDG